MVVVVETGGWFVVVRVIFDLFGIKSSKPVVALRQLTERKNAVDLTWFTVCKCSSRCFSLQTAVTAST